MFWDPSAKPGNVLKRLRVICFFLKICQFFFRVKPQKTFNRGETPLGRYLERALYKFLLID